MNIVNVDIKSLMPDPSNARKHDDKNIAAIKGSLVKFGQQKPIVVNQDNVVIAGNGTLAAALELGWSDIDVVKTNLNAFEQSAFAIADNRTSELAAWDDEILSKTLHALREDGFELPDIGFDNSSLYDLGIDTPDFQPVGDDEQGKLDEKKKVTCPECEYVFEPR